MNEPATLEARVAARLAAPQPQPQQQRPEAQRPARSEKIVAFYATSPDNDAAEPRRPGVTRDLASAIDLVQEASEAIRIRDEQIVHLEARLEEVLSQASEEIQQLSGQLKDCEERLLAADARLQAADARAEEAEIWLDRLHSAVMRAFSAQLRDPSSAAPAVPPSRPAGERFVPSQQRRSMEGEGV